MQSSAITGNKMEMKNGSLLNMKSTEKEDTVVVTSSSSSSSSSPSSTTTGTDTGFAKVKASNNSPTTEGGGGGGGGGGDDDGEEDATGGEGQKELMVGKCSPRPSLQIGGTEMEEKSMRHGKKVLGVEFAPLVVPLERRLQTLAVASWILTFFLMGPGCIFLLLYLFFYTQLRFIPILYLIWFFYDKDRCNQGGRGSKWVRKWRLWKWYCDYFPIRLIKTCDLDPKKNYIFGSHPHGILCSAAFGNFATEGTNFSKMFPGITPHLLTLEGHYLFPFYREYLMSSGACSASKQSLNYLLSRPEGGNAAVLVVGGASESLESCPGSYILKLKERKGFIKTALRHGANIVPIFSFGEIEIYTQVHFPTGSRRKNIQNQLQQVLGLAPCLFNGRGIFQYSFGIIPQRKPLTTVVGIPIAVEKNSNPTPEEIEALHAKYIDGLEKLFYCYRDKYATPGSQLKII